MHLFASHFGFYEVAPGPRLRPFRHDPAPSAVGLAYLDLADSPNRILTPMARRGWLAGDNGAARGQDDFVPLSLDAAASRAAAELDRIRSDYGNAAVFGGSYGWGSAGRFHHPQSQLKRFLNLAGGFVSAVNTYSYGTAKVLIPHIVGAPYADPGGLCPSWDLIVDNCRTIIAFGGMRLANAQIEAGGVGQHRVAGWLRDFAAAGGTMITLSPDARDAPQGEHLAIRPGTDTAAMLAMAHVLIEEDLADAGFLGRCTVGADRVLAYLRGATDGTPKTPEWAASITGLAAEDLRRLARLVATTPSLVNLSWSLQRARFGEQPYFAAFTLAAMAGRIGRPGQGLAFGLSAISTCGQPTRRLVGPSLPQGANEVSDFIPVARITEMLERPGRTLAYNGRQLQLPDIRLVWWAGGNPYHHHQDLNRLARAWKRPETVIVHDSIWTATARRADLVFPSALPFERSDIAAASRDNWIAHSRKVMDPPSGVTTDHEVFAEIAGHLGLRDAFTENRDEAAWLEWLYAGYLERFPELPDWPTFRARGYAALDPEERAPAPLQPFADFVADPELNPLPTPSGRIELWSETIAGFHYADCPPHAAWLDADAEEDRSLPFRLLSPQPETRLHSQLDDAAPAKEARQDGLECVRANPIDLDAQGIVDGTAIELFNARGIVRAAARADARVAPGTLVLPTGGRFDPVEDTAGRLVDRGGNPNTLTADRPSSALSQGAGANHPRVGLRPVAASALLREAAQ